MDFLNAASHGFLRVAACTAPISLADPRANAATLAAQARLAVADGARVVTFAELSLTGYSIEDLFLQDALLDQVRQGLADFAVQTQDLPALLVVGAPLLWGNRLYNCAVTVLGGAVVAVNPKSYLPNYREFYEKRHFASGAGVRGEIDLGALGTVPFGPDVLVEVGNVPGLRLHTEICEDMWVPVPPSSQAALAGASLLINLSGSPITVGRSADRHLLAQGQSARALAAYVYTANGTGESTTDLAWDGMTMIYELGSVLASGERFSDQPVRTLADIDLDRIRQERLRVGSFDDNARAQASQNPHHLSARVVRVELPEAPAATGLRRPLDRFPFVPDDPAQLAQDCYEAYSIQVAGLAQRLRAIGQPKVVIGVSGGLDSTQALIVAARAMDLLGRPRTDILAYTLPGFATGETSRGLAHELANGLGVTFEQIDIRPLAKQLLEDIQHPFADGHPVYDTTFENVQAGVRTDLLFRLAGQHDGIVLGTGDLSELALGWCTYGVGDHMSHYNVNAGIPKTLIQHLLRWIIAEDLFPAVNSTLLGIVSATISPELVPADAGVMQSTEAKIGPYALQDFNLYYFLRFGLRPSKVAFLAYHAWRDRDAGAWPENYPESAREQYGLAAIRKWLEVFVRRYFAFSQFKRSALPNGPKVVAGGSLSPRGDWRAPSDGNAVVWLADLERVPLTAAGEEDQPSEAVPESGPRP